MSVKLTPELSDLLMECGKSTEAFCRIMMPRLFSRPFSAALGRQICEAIDDDTHQHTLILAPRSIGKSSIAQAAAIRWALFGLSKYIVPVSASGTLAEQQSANIKDMLASEAIMELWGDQKSDEWAIERWTMKNNTHVFPRGYGQQLHGLNHRGKRPDRFIIDDLEDPFHMDSEEYRAKVNRWFWQTLYGCFDHSRDDWRVIMIGTLSHEDCILAKLMKDPDWHVVRLALCDDNFNSVDENYMSTAKVRAMADRFRRANELDSFYRQYMNIPMAGENRTFLTEHFKYYEELPKHLEYFIIMDPAKTAKLTSADTAIVGVGFDMRNHAFYIVDIERGKFHPDEMHAKAINMAQRLKARVIGVEVTGLNEHVTSPLNNEIIRRTKGNIEIVELHARGKKEDRIKQSLGPLYRQGLVYHNKSCCNVLEHQLLSFPASALFDVMDATSYISEIIERGGRFFEVPETPEEIARDYEDLDQDWGGHEPREYEFNNSWMTGTGF